MLAVGTGSVADMVAVSYWRAQDQDPGLTTEIVLAIGDPVWIAGNCGFYFSVRGRVKRLKKIVVAQADPTCFGNGYVKYIIARPFGGLPIVH